MVGTDCFHYSGEKVANMKILLISNMYPDKKYPAYGIFVKRFVKEIERLGYECNKVVMTKSSNSALKIWRYFIFFVKAFIETLFTNCDIIYIHYASISSIPVLAACYFRPNLKIFTNLHGSDVVPENHRQENLQKFTKKILSKSCKIIVPSEYFKQLVCTKYSINQKKVHVFPSSGVNPGIFYRSPTNTSYGKAQVNPRLLTFGMAGRISKNKGWDTFINAIRITELTGLHAQYSIVGSGSEDQNLDGLIQSEGLQDIVRRIPMLSQEKLRNYYDSLDYFVFPSRRVGESLGLVGLEAMACGTPVIGSDFAALKDYIVDDYNGFKFDVGSASSLSLVMQGRILSSTNTDYRRLQNGAIQTSSKYFSDEISSQLKQIIIEEA